MRLFELSLGMMDGYIKCEVRWVEKGVLVFFHGFATSLPKQTYAISGVPKKITKNKPVIQFKGRFVKARHIKTMYQRGADETFKFPRPG